MSNSSDLTTVVRSQLATGEAEKIKQFLNSIDNFSILQYPGWEDRFIDRKKSYNYFIASNRDEIVGYAMVVVLLNKICRISFGPVTDNKETAVKLIEFILDYYKKTSIARVDIQYGLGVSHEASFVQYKIASKYNTSFYYGVKNKSTIVLDLSLTEEALLKNLSKGHKSAVKKAVKSNLTTKAITCAGEFENYVNGYIQMYQSRKLSVNVQETKQKFFNYFDLITKDGLGFILGVYSEENKLLGGCTIVYQKNTAIYYNGFSDPELRTIPINHLTLFEAIKKSKEEGMSFFDFGGYNFFVKPGTQVYNINIFKKGFCADAFYFFPPIMQVHLKPFQSKVLSFVEKVRSR